MDTRLERIVWSVLFAVYSIGVIISSIGIYKTWPR